MTPEVTICAGDSATLTVTAEGGTTTMDKQYSYVWDHSSSDTTSSVIVKPATESTYKVVVSDANGCTATATTTVKVIALPVITDIVVANNTNCSDDYNGSITFSEVADAEYSIDGGNSYQASFEFKGLSAGTYTAVIRNTNGCVSKSKEIVVENEGIVPIIEISSKVDVDCYGSNTGSIDITITDNSEPTTYAWTKDGISVATTEDLSGIVAGTYHVVVTSGNGCEAVEDVIIKEPTELKTTVTEPQSICPGTSAELTVTVSGGTKDYSYSWSDGAATVGDNNATIKVEPTETTTYYVTVSDAHSCTATDSTTVTIKMVATGMQDKEDTILCNGSSFSVTPTSTDSLPAGTQYIWTVDDNASVTGCSAQETQTPAPISQALNNTSTSRQTVTYHVTPILDNCSGAEFTIAVVVEPTPELTLTCPADVYDTLAYGDCEKTIDPAIIDTPMWSHSLGWTEVTISSDMPKDSIYFAGDNIITWTLTDECGNTTTCEQHVYVSYPECPDAVDADGNTYESVLIGCDCWTQRNLESKKYSDGTDIPGVYNYQSEMYRDVDDNVAKFGRLYDWESVIKDTVENSYGHIQGICPDGWYLPTADKFAELSLKGASALKSPLYWLDGGGTNETGFSSLPAGYYNRSIGRYLNLMGEAYYWSTTRVDDHWTPVPCNIHYTCNAIINADSQSGVAYSVRCIKEKE